MSVFLRNASPGGGRGGLLWPRLFLLCFPVCLGAPTGPAAAAAVISFSALLAVHAHGFQLCVLCWREEGVLYAALASLPLPLCSQAGARRWPPGGGPVLQLCLLTVTCSSGTWLLWGPALLGLARPLPLGAQQEVMGRVGEGTGFSCRKWLLSLLS